MPRLKRIKSLSGKSRRLRLIPMPAHREYWCSMTLRWEFLAGARLSMCTHDGRELYEGIVLGVAKPPNYKAYLKIRWNVRDLLWPHVVDGIPKIVYETSRITKPSRSSRRR